jgi:hypothetical protein
MSKSAKKKPAKKAAKTSTALAVRTVRINDPNGLLPVAQSPVGQLGELATVGALGLAELTLTPEEEKALSVAVNQDEILIKPDGTPYLPWPAYARWFSSAFGRLGWSCVPAGRPQKVDNLVVAPYLLYIHGKPVAFAWGEQDYHPDNKRQSYGDAIESTQGSAYRRFAKRLQMGLELWDKAYLAEFKALRCIAVSVTKRGEQKTEWRRKVDPPLPGEKGRVFDVPVGNYSPGGDWSPEPIPDTVKTVSSRIENASTITAEQRKRLADIVERHGRAPSEVSLWLKKRYGVTKSDQIQRRDYEAICKALEARGALVMPGDGGE